MDEKTVKKITEDYYQFKETLSARRYSYGISTDIVPALFIVAMILRGYYEKEKS